MSRLRVASAQASLLTALDVLVDHANRRAGLALDADDRLVRGEALVLARLLPGDAALTPDRCARLASAVGLLSAVDGRLVPTRLEQVWTELDTRTRAGLVYAAWCHRLPWSELGLSGSPVELLRERRMTVLHWLRAAPVGFELQVAPVSRLLSERLDLPPTELIARCLAVVFLQPLVDLDVAVFPSSSLDQPVPGVPPTVRLCPDARAVVGTALVVGGADIPPVVDAN